MINALSEGDHANSNFDWTGYACKKRYRVNWEMIRELSSDVNYGRPHSSPVAGVFSSGHCSDTSFDGCKDTTSSKVLFKMDRALDQFMIGELFINGNVGSLMEQEHFSSNFPNEARNDIISCSGTHINKMNITETSATTATVIVENKFVPDPANSPACATNSNFLENANHDSSMALKLEK